MNPPEYIDAPVSDYDYDLPEELIAQQGTADRASSRLLVLDRRDGSISHQQFSSITDYVRPGDLWLFNNTRVFPARIFLRKETGARIELLFLHEEAGGGWAALAKPGKRISKGTVLLLDDGRPACVVTEKNEEGIVRVDAAGETSIFSILSTHGEVPLPPYIKEKPSDIERYQTIYSSSTGSSAAPTAGLHFTESLMAELRSLARVGFITLHIGMDTFRPIKADTLGAHEMHTEVVSIQKSVIEEIARTKRCGGRVVAVGTTTVRAIESYASGLRDVIDEDEEVIRFKTGMFIRPGYEFKTTGAMVTNFHLPRSTLLVLVSTFAGRENIARAYTTAIAEKYRFYSFGDAMFIG